MGVLSYNYPPTLGALIDMIKITNSYFKKEKTKLKQLELYYDKIEFLSKEKLNELEKRQIVIMIYKVPILGTKRLILKHGNLHDFEQVYEYDFLS